MSGRDRDHLTIVPAARRATADRHEASSEQVSSSGAASRAASESLTITSVSTPLGAILDKVRAKLPPDRRAQVDAHVTQAEALLAEILDGLPLYRLRGREGLWARTSDVATLAEVRVTAVSTWIDRCERKGIAEVHVCRNVGRTGLVTLSEKVDASSVWPDQGATFLNLTAVRLYLLQARGERGTRFQIRVNKLLDASVQLERLAYAALFAWQEEQAAAATTQQMAALAAEVHDLRDQLQTVTKIAADTAAAVKATAKIAKTTKRDDDSDAAWKRKIRAYARTHPRFTISDLPPILMDGFFLGSDVVVKRREIRLRRLLREIGLDSPEKR